MIATITVTTKGVANKTKLLAALAMLLESKDFGVSNGSDGLTIAGEIDSLIPHEVNSQTTPETPKSALAIAHTIVHGDREATYGDAGKNLRTIAAYWNTHLLAAKSIEARLTEADVCGMMILLKQARLASNPQHRDSLVDIAGYVELKDVVDQQNSNMDKCPNKV